MRRSRTELNMAAPPPVPPPPRSPSLGFPLFHDSNNRGKLIILWLFEEQPYSFMIREEIFFLIYQNLRRMGFIGD